LGGLQLAQLSFSQFLYVRQGSESNLPSTKTLGVFGIVKQILTVHVARSYNCYLMEPSLVSRPKLMSVRESALNNSMILDIVYEAQQRDEMMWYLQTFTRRGWEPERLQGGKFQCIYLPSPPRGHIFEN